MLGRFALEALIKLYKMNLNEITPLQPFSFWRYGKEYFEAYLIVAEAKANPIKLLGVKFFLLGHSIEASLKAFLLMNGFSVSELKSKKYGHNLIKLLKESSKVGLGKIVIIDSEEADLIKLLNGYYLNKEFQYPKLGSKQLPYFEVIEEIAGKLTLAIYFKLSPRKPLKILDEDYKVERLPVESWF